jgi:TFIIF-interacting CTD phosphatase-like protein
MIGLLRHYPSEFNEVAYRYEEGEHWWHELCYFTSNLMKNQAYDVEDFIPRQ